MILRQPTISRHVRQKKGIHCHWCQKFLCDKCIMGVWPQIKAKQHLLHSDTDPFCCGLEKYYESKGETVPLDFVCHCCMISVHRDKACAEEESMIPPSIQGLIGGSLGYPEYEVMIGATTKCMDLHALGAEKDMLPAVAHMGFGEEYGSRVTEANMDPSTTMPEDYLDFMTNITLRPPHALKSDKYKLSRPKMVSDTRCVVSGQ